MYGIIFLAEISCYYLMVSPLWFIHKRSTCWQLSRKWAQERNWLGWVRHWEPYGGPGLETPTPQPLPKGFFLVFWGHVELFLSNNTWCIICVGLGVAMPLGRLRWFLWPTTTMHDMMYYPMLTKHISKKEIPTHKELKTTTTTTTKCCTQLSIINASSKRAFSKTHQPHPRLSLYRSHDWISTIAWTIRHSMT